jgi:cobalt-zinc-cadmium efflux system protein
MAHDQHDHEPSPGSRIGVAFWLNLAFALLEVAGGLWTNSVAVLSDALHDFGDSVALGLTWHFARVSKRKGDETFTFGYRRFSILGALVMSFVLFAGGLVVLFEAIPRLFSPEASNAKGMIYLAVAGIAINGIAALRMHGGRSLSERVVTWHFVEDVLGWVSVLVAGIVMSFTDIRILDPVLSILITGYVLWNVGRRLKDTLVILLQGTPQGVLVAQVEDVVRRVPGVCDVHHTHIWTQDGERHVLTTHVVAEEETTLGDTDDLRRRIRESLRPLGILHTTIEVERKSDGCRSDGDDCHSS